MKSTTLAVGQHLSESSFYTVEKIKGDDVQLRVNGQTDPVVLSKGYIDNLLNSSDYIEKEEKVTKTEAATLFTANPGVIMTVTFNKKVDEKEVLAEVMKEIAGAKLADIEKAVKAGIKKSINGEPRTMRGRHYGELNEFGRMNFVDMDVAQTTGSHDSRMRQVDPRTILGLILKGTKYTVK